MPSALRARLDQVVEEARRLAREPAAPGGAAILQRLTESLPYAALVANNAGRYVVVNPVACELTGYTREELRRMSVWELTAAPLQPHTDLLWRAFLQQREQSGDYLLVKKDGQTRQMVYAARAHVLPALHLSLLRPAEPTRVGR